MKKDPRFTNKLIHETSPYLLQHAHNPVDWYPWGEEAFEKARLEQKPLLVSIGYSACHWCHVMEHESFSDEETARILNENFVSIKVDMEERPDIDQIYMAFVQMTTGRGGWPMNVFITPEKAPFFGGTYFPPETRYGMPSFQNVLLSIRDAYDRNREDLEASAAEMLKDLQRISAASAPPSSYTTEDLDTAFRKLLQNFDAKNGGFGGAPKFPPAMTLEFILRYWKRTGDQAALNIAVETARKMANGGIYDQLGGGFHRYAVDAVWLVPHFEKMLYDNAQLIRIYLHLFQITKDEFFQRVAVETLEYVRREMLDSSGGYYSSQDADSEGEEGKFFVWSREEVAELLGADADEFCRYYGVTDEGNFEGGNILNVSEYSSEIFNRLRPAREKLFAERERRIKPFRDEKVLTAWNGLMLMAFAEAAAILGSEEYLAIARRNGEFLLSELTRDGRLLRTWKDGAAKLPGYIEDYANAADGFITLFQVSGEAKYLRAASELASTMITDFWDEDAGGFFFTSNGHEDLPVRSKDLYDNATPSGNSVAADVLLRLARITGDERLLRFGNSVIRLGATQAAAHPQGFGRLLSTMEYSLANGKEVVVAGGGADSDLYKAFWSEYRPFEIFAMADEGSERSVGIFEGKAMIDGRPTAYICENFVCDRPAFDLDGL